MEQRLCSALGEAIVVGREAPRLPNTSLLLIRGVETEVPGGTGIDSQVCVKAILGRYSGLHRRGTQLAARQATHRAAFEQRFPQLAHVPFEFAWSGVEGISRNGTNFFGRMGGGVYLAGGYNGSGVSRGTAFGTALADYASGGQSTLIDDCLASAPGAWIPPRPILDIGALLTVRSRFRGVGLDR